ncbi:MAG: hypothetical protein ACLRFP_04880 [Alphaproteobacteria bacterium]
MKLNWKQKDFESDIDFILFHQTDDTPMWWKSELYRVHPSLDFDYAQSLPQDERFKYLRRELLKIRNDKQADIEKSIQMFQDAWEPVAKNLNDAYSSAFDMDCSGILNDMVGLVGLNPICPRDLSDNSFSVYYYFDPNYAVAVALHEITHFVWFNAWQKHFHDDEEEYNFPHLKWLLSELVVETIIRNSEIAKLISPPQYIAYDYFYRMDIDGKPIFDTLHDMHTNRKSFTDFMETAYDWIRKNEPELRAKIAEAEK